MLDYLLLGVIQGIFEWIPVSSEGVLAMAAQLLGGYNPVDIAIFLHLGTLFSAVIYFRKDWLSVLTLRDKPLLRFLVISTIISLAIGFPLYLLVRDVAGGYLLLAVMGFGLLATSFFHRSRKSGGMPQDRLALVAGFLQGLSVIPGVSRSGATVFGLSLGKSSGREILRISYMMSVPVVLASSIYLLVDSPVLVAGWPALVVSFLVGLLSLHALMRLVERINFFIFTLAFALLCFAGAMIGLVFL